MRGLKKTAIFAATVWEIGGALKSPKFAYRQICKEPFEVWENETKIAVVTRIGLASASLGFSWAARNFDFDTAINIGSVGAADPKFGAKHIGAYFDISQIKCIEPYCQSVFKLEALGGIATATLATSSRPVSTAVDRLEASKSGELVDMEGWALAQAAQAFAKKLFMRKILTDFSPECDIHANILSVCRSLEKLDDFWI